MSEVEKMYKLANVKPVYRYDCYLTDTIGIEAFPLCSCSKGEIKDYCTNKRDYRYCKVYKVNKFYPPFTAEKQLSLIKWLSNFWVHINKVNEQFNISTGGGYVSYYAEDLADAIALYINSKWNNLTDQERTEIKEILRG